MKNKKDAEDLKEVLGKFLHCWNEVSEYWDIYDSSLEVENYPFHENFDHIDVERWVIDMCESIDAEQKENVDSFERGSTHIVFLNGNSTNDN